MAHTETNESKPIWYSPAWITAIVGLLSAILTVPDVIGRYYEKEKEIDLATQRVELAKIENKAQIDEEHFRKLITVLNQRNPEERKMVLRFIAKTLEDPNLSEWAINELKILEGN